MPYRDSPNTRLGACQDQWANCSFLPEERGPGTEESFCVSSTEKLVRRLCGLPSSGLSLSCFSILRGPPFFCLKIRRHIADLHLWLTQPPPVPCVGGCGCGCECEKNNVNVNRDGVMHHTCSSHKTSHGRGLGIQPLAPCCVGHVWWFSLPYLRGRLCPGFTRAKKGQSWDKFTRTSCVSASLLSATSTGLGQAERR
jgi:hypothetical protein